MTVREVFGTFYAIESAQRRQVFGGFRTLMLSEVFRGFEVSLDLVEIAADIC